MMDRDPVPLESLDGLSLFFPDLDPSPSEPSGGFPPPGTLQLFLLDKQFASIFRLHRIARSSTAMFIDLLLA